METKKLFVLASCLTSLALLTASCAPAAAPAPAPTTKPAAATAPAATLAPKSQPTPAAPGATPKPAAAEPRYGGILTTEAGNEPPHFDVDQTRNPYTVWYIGMAYNSIMEYDPLNPSKIIGDLAQSWEMSPDGKTYTFRFNKGITWHDGKPFTAEDARVSIMRMWNPPEGVTSGWKDAFRGLEKAEALDADTLKISLEYPRASLMSWLATATYIYPKHVLDAKGSMKKDVVGTGPFKLKSYTAGTSAVMEKNANYFKKGRPYLDGFVRYLLKDASTRFAALRTGQITLTGPYASALPPPQMEQVKKEMADKLVTGEMNQLNGFFANLNVTKPPFNDVRVRRAISLAMDRQKLRATLSQGYGYLGAQVSPGTEYALPEDELLRLPGFRQPKDQDIAEAKKLLADAGFPNGLKTGFLVRTATLHQAFAEVTKDQMKAIGVDFNIEVVDATTWEDRVRRMAYDAGMKGYSQTISDPDDGLAFYLSDNKDLAPTGFADKEIDDLYIRQSRSLDPAERKRIVLDMQRKLIESASRPEGFWPPTFYAASKRLNGYVAPIGTYNNAKFEVVWLAP
ncbi:MAG: hypothetical protein HYX92_06190 [Chloroflexi bacterium]|nr:hypothetical protein [Chloroflexota bacterium]